MDLYLLRHAKAYKRSPKFRPDSIRPLTPDGETQIRQAASGIKRLDGDFDLILSSPYVRAAKTAQIFYSVVKTGKLQLTEAMVPDADPSAIIEEINENYPRDKSIVVVGHEPHMSKLLSILLSGRPDMSIDFKKSGFCKLTVNNLRAGKCACLKWLLTPRQLARLGKAA
jgi:phosphohistidine phosphatase